MENYIYKSAEIFVTQGDIVEMGTEAIVNAANSTLLGGSGVDGAIHKAGGPIILEQCKKIGGCPTGEVKLTVGGDLKARYVIHAVGPIYRGKEEEKELLYSAYYNSLVKAKNFFMKSISFPAISTGAYGYPKEEATRIAIAAVKDFIDETKFPIRICFVLYDEETYKLYIKLFNENFVD